MSVFHETPLKEDLFDCQLLYIDEQILRTSSSKHEKDLVKKRKGFVQLRAVLFLQEQVISVDVVDEDKFPDYQKKLATWKEKVKEMKKAGPVMIPHPGNFQYFPDDPEYLLQGEEEDEPEMPQATFVRPVMQGAQNLGGMDEPYQQPALAPRPPKLPMKKINIDCTLVFYITGASCVAAVPYDILNDQYQEYIERARLNLPNKS